MQRISAHVSELKFNDGETISINKNDIVLFVGPNNAGKSQALKDIYYLCDRKISPVVIADIKTEKSEGLLKSFCDKVASADNKGGYIYYSGLNVSVNYNSFAEDDFRGNQYYGEYRNFFVAYLNTEERLSICNPANNITRDETWTNPIHYAAFDSQYGSWLSKCYRKSFGDELIADRFYGARIPLRIGESINLEGKYEDTTEHINAYAEVLNKYKKVDEQGDGIRSFTGILLYLMMEYYCTYIIDEPESFLHPPQARALGQIIGETLTDNQQAFISTHSEEFIKGLLDICQDRLKIVRITRDGDINKFFILDNDNISGVFKDPLLKYSNIMSGLFHKKVVLCESDSDCKFYSAIEGYINQTHGKYSETLFIHCGGKHRMAKTVKSLLSLGIDVALIPDIDILDDEAIFRGVADVFGINWNEVEKDYRILKTSVDSGKKKLLREEIRSRIENILNSSKDPSLSKEEIGNVRACLKNESKWKELKHAGREAIPSGDATKSYNAIEDVLKKHKIYIVPKGELEGFVKAVGGHGPEWVNNVFEQYPNFEDAVYLDVRRFIGEII